MQAVVVAGKCADFNLRRRYFDIKFERIKCKHFCKAWSWFDIHLSYLSLIRDSDQKWSSYCSYVCTRIQEKILEAASPMHLEMLSGFVIFKKNSLRCMQLLFVVKKNISESKYFWVCQLRRLFPESRKNACPPMQPGFQKKVRHVC